MGISALSWGAIRLSQTTSFHSLSHRCDIQSNPDFNWAVLTEKTTYWFLLLRIWFCLLLWFILLVLPPAFGKCHNQNGNYVASRQKCIFVIDINNFPSLDWLWFVKLSVPWNTKPVALADCIGGRHLTEVLPIAFSMDFHVVTKDSDPSLAVRATGVHSATFSTMWKKLVSRKEWSRYERQGESRQHETCLCSPDLPCSFPAFVWRSLKYSQQTSLFPS